MSIERTYNSYGSFRTSQERAEWEKLERIAYCDQSMNEHGEGLMDRLAKFLKNIF